MKVAVCLSGQPRFVLQAYPNLFNRLIKPFNSDVFVHSWYDQSLVGTNFVDYKVNGWNNSLPASLYPADVDKLIMQLYNPKKAVFENQKKFVDSRIPLDEILKSHARHYTRDYFVNMLYSSWYSIQKANLLKEEYRLENDIKYDFVIRARFDSTLNLPIDLENLNPNYLYTDHRVGLPPRMIEDWFGFGSNVVMNIYSSAFNYMEYGVMLANSVDGIFCGETHLYQMMQQFGISHIPIKNLVHTPIRQNVIK